VDALGASGLDALICTLPEDILLLSGYWPVVGTAIAVASRRGVAVLAPEDERDLAEGGWADEVRTYSPGSLARLADPAAAVGEPLAALLRERDLENGRLGLEDGPIYEESSYAAMYLYGGAVRDVIGAAAPGAELVSGMSAIARLRSVMTPFEVNRVRLACRIAGSAFTDARRALRPGVREPEGAVAVQSRLFTEGMAHPGVSRAGGFAWCMSGPNSALAGIAYARTRNRALQQGDLVLLHCNSYVDGYWTDITRTYVLGNPDHRQQAMYEAIFAARAAALDALRPGVTGAEVDAAAREVLTERGFGQEFTHGLGHNVGFSAISGEFPPRLHPASTDRLQAGMTFNIEPSIYIEGYGGLRHCDVVTLRDEGPDVLTDFGSDPADLILPI
jgi:Xaa-Pro aminopeptidase